MGLFAANRGIFSVTDRGIFVSYTRADKPQVAAFIDRLEKEDLTVWWDDRMGDGKYEEEIFDRIENKSDAFIAILTENSAGKSSSGWVNTEIKAALKSIDSKNIMFLQIGNFAMSPNMSSLIHDRHINQADDFDDLFDQVKFQARLDRLKDLVSGKPTGDIAGYIRKRQEENPEKNSEALLTVSDWYEAERSPAQQALALSIAALADAPIEIVFITASLLQERMEASLRELTEDEIKEQERALGKVSRSQRLADVHATREIITDPATQLPFEIVRFRDPEWRHDLLDHIWSERDDVRDLFIDWITELIESKQFSGLGETLALSLGQIAQKQFKSVEFCVLLNWLSGLNFENFHTRSRVLGRLLSSAIVKEQNEAAMVQLIERLIKSAGGPGGPLRLEHLMAIDLAMGPLGIARPSIGLHFMKRFGRRLFFGERVVRDVALGSAMIHGAKTTDEEAVSDEDDRGGSSSSEDKETSVGDEPVGADGDAFDAAGTGSDGDNDQAGESNPEDAEAFESIAADTDGGFVHALPAALALAELGDWADEPASDEKAKGLRQVPIFALLSAFEYMPVYTRKNGTRLTVEDLMFQIDTRDPKILDRIAKGFERALVATPYAGADAYRPRAHLRRIFIRLSARRHSEVRWLSKEDSGIESRLDPFIYFAARIYHAARARHGEDAEAILDALQLHVDAEEEARIKDRDILSRGDGRNT